MQAATEGSPHFSSPVEAMSESDAVKNEMLEAGAPGIDEYPHGARLTAIVVSLMLGMFLVALDNVSHIFFNVDRADQPVDRPSLARRFQKSLMNSTISTKYRGTDLHIS